MKKVFTFIIIGYLLKLVLFTARTVLFGNAVFSFFSDGGVPWYMFVLAMFISVSYLLRNRNKKIILCISVAIALIVGYFDFIGDFLYLSRFFVFYPFYVLGQMTPEIVIGKLNKLRSFKIISVCIIVIWLLICITQIDDIYFLRLIFTGRNSYSVNEKLLTLGPVYRLLCYFITVLVSLSVICLVPRKRIAYLSDFGKNTIQVYFWHSVFLSVLKKIGAVDFFVGSLWGSILWIILAVLLSVLLSTKYFSFPTSHVSRLCDAIFNAVDLKGRPHKTK